MSLTRSAHVDPFCRDHLPPPAEWPALLLDEPWLRYPERVNCATALLDATIAEPAGDRPRPARRHHRRARRRPPLPAGPGRGGVDLRGAARDRGPDRAPAHERARCG